MKKCLCEGKPSIAFLLKFNINNPQGLKLSRNSLTCLYILDANFSLRLTDVSISLQDRKNKKAKINCKRNFK